MSEDIIRSSIIGESPRIRHLHALIAKLAPTRLSVLIRGPTGSGKELVARGLHAASGRSGPFVPFNVCAVPDPLFESTLFGHVRGGFTGATSDNRGYLAEADRGTVFLDEISGLSLPSQAKLLRVLETGEFRPVGARSNGTSDFRVLSATNEDLDALIAGERFRADLVHRLAGVEIMVPPLKDRLEDVPLLARHLVQRSAGELLPPVTFTPGAIRVLQAYHWPGNVRELQHVIARAMVFATTPVVGAEDVRAVMSGSAVGLEVVAERSSRISRARQELVALLEAVGWDTSLAARMLGVNRTTVYRRMARLGIPTPRRRGRGAPGPTFPG